MWSAESGGYDAFTPLVAASQWAHSLRFGTAIVPVYTRGAHTLASTVASAVPSRTRPLRARHRYLLGRDRRTLERLSFEKPYQRVRDTIRFLRAALAGEKVTEEYETFAVNGFRLGITVPEQPPILVAALREGMLKLAGREGDGAIINWLSADDVKTVVPHVGADKEIVARIFVFPNDDAGLARAVGKRAIASYLTVPVYAAFHEWLGRGDELKNLWRLWKEGDRKAAAESIPDHVVDELLVWGKPEQCREHIQRYIDNGVTTPAPALFCGPGSAPRAVLEAPASRSCQRYAAVFSFTSSWRTCARRRNTSVRTKNQPGSISPRCSANRAEVGAAWWLLCRPSPRSSARASDRSSRSCVGLLAEPVTDRVDRAREHHVDAPRGARRRGSRPSSGKPSSRHPDDEDRDADRRARRASSRTRACRAGRPGCRARTSRVFSWSLATFL